MKKFFVLMLSVALLAAIPGMAFALKGGVKPATRAVFESDLISTGDGCMVVGEVFVRADGSAKIEFKVPEVTEDTEFTVTLFCGETEFHTEIVTILAGGDEFSEEFPAGTVVFDCAQPSVTIGVTGEDPTIFSGFCLSFLDS